MKFLCVCGQKCVLLSSLEKWICLSESRYFSSHFNGIQYGSWSVFLSEKCPPSQKFLSDCLQRLTNTSTSVATSWCFYFSPGVNIVEMVTSWRRDFLNKLQLLVTLSVGPYTLAVSIPPHTHQCKNLKVAEKFPMFEVRLCKKYECCDKAEFRGESPNLCECLTVWMEF